MSVLTSVSVASDSRQQVVGSSVETADSRWQGLYRVGAAAALIMLGPFPVQSFVFIAWPPPSAGLAGAFDAWRPLVEGSPKSARQRFSWERDAGTASAPAGAAPTATVPAAEEALWPSA